MGFNEYLNLPTRLFCLNECNVMYLSEAIIGCHCNDYRMTTLVVRLVDYEFLIHYVVGLPPDTKSPGKMENNTTWKRYRAVVCSHFKEVMCLMQETRAWKSDGCMGMLCLMPEFGHLPAIIICLIIFDHYHN